MGGGKPPAEVREKLELFRYLIEVLDGVSVFRRASPEDIEDAFKSLKSATLTEEWKKIRHYVRKIAYLPLEVPGVPELMRLGAYIRIFLPLTMIFAIIGLGHSLRPKLLPAPPFVATPERLAIFFCISGLLAVSLIVIDYKIRRKVIAYERAHRAKLGKGRAAVKKAVQKLIFAFARELRKHKVDPEKYKLTLFHRDYDGVKIIKVSRKLLKIFPRKYNMYQVVVEV